MCNIIFIAIIRAVVVIIVVFVVFVVVVHTKTDLTPLSWVWRESRGLLVFGTMLFAASELIHSHSHTSNAKTKQFRKNIHFGFLRDIEQQVRRSVKCKKKNKEEEAKYGVLNVNKVYIVILWRHKNKTHLYYIRALILLTANVHVWVTSYAIIHIYTIYEL